MSTHWYELPDRQQRILAMRFYGNMTQAEIGQKLGVSQMHVSRLLARALDYLRECLSARSTGSATGSFGRAAGPLRRALARSGGGSPAWPRR